MDHLKFNVTKLEKLNDPKRLEVLPPDVLWHALGEPVGPVVEIGAGTGIFAAAFVARSPEIVVYAVDTEDMMVEWMQENRPEVMLGRIVPLKSTETRVPLADGIASALYMINLHHELAEPTESYAESFRLLAPGGRLLVVDWANRETPEGPPVSIRVSAAKLRAYLEEAGFIDLCVNESLLPWHTVVTGSRPPVWAGGDPHA